ncbi:hypothetical protein [Desulfosporosinus youngiae]|uniref:Uncharacterized protein n=1 Tax=Desulfosporosinus youngiae DSM 17734 TaxID=768710 RepID=H5Y249_9FIRM|nr:hypothetical protein [Desulfosporosinus youngiae]EHQ88247.1 hypothetical protein DesyoDRAFT_1076 [Desulfosporosinus youngiae DSM 17734]
MAEINDPIKCAYCGKEKQPGEMMEATIFTRERKWNKRKRKNESYVTKQKKWYCKGTNCHINDQMAHDG